MEQFILDGDFLSKVMKYMDARTLATTSCVNRIWHKAAQDDKLWENMSQVLGSHWLWKPSTEIFCFGSWWISETIFSIFSMNFILIGRRPICSNNWQEETLCYSCFEL